MSSRSSTKWGKTSTPKAQHSVSDYYGYDDYDELKPDEKSRYSLPSLSRDKSVKKDEIKPEGNIRMLRELRKGNTSQRLKTLPSSTSITRQNSKSGKRSKLKNRNMSISKRYSKSRSFETKRKRVNNKKSLNVNHHFIRPKIK